MSESDVEGQQNDESSEFPLEQHWDTDTDTDSDSDSDADPQEETVSSGTGSRLSQMTWSAAATLALGLVAGTVLILGLGWFINSLLTDSSVNVSDTVQQVLWIIFGVMIILLMLLAYSVVNHFTDPNTERGALGLPEGSIAAVIALMLIFIFSLTSIFIFTQVRDTETQGRVSTGLTLADVKSLPESRLLGIERIPGSNPVSYQVTMASPSKDSIDIGRTTLGTISTLLVAIVGFYFGQRTAASATAQGVRLAKDAAGMAAGLNDGQARGGHRDAQHDGHNQSRPTPAKKTAAPTKKAAAPTKKSAVPAKKTAAKRPDRPRE